MHELRGQRIICRRHFSNPSLNRTKYVIFDFGKSNAPISETAWLRKCVQNFKTLDAIALKISRGLSNPSQEKLHA